MSNLGPDLPEMWKINRLRDALHISSILYYKHDISLFTDSFFDHLSQELVEAHEANPELVGVGYEHEMFADWDGSTGFHLTSTPYSDTQVRLTMTKMGLVNE